VRHLQPGVADLLICTKTTTPLPLCIPQLPPACDCGGNDGGAAMATRQWRRQGEGQGNGGSKGRGAAMALMEAGGRWRRQQHCVRAEPWKRNLDPLGVTVCKSTFSGDIDCLGFSALETKECHILL
jgi:hypothetical protein